MTFEWFFFPKWVCYEWLVDWFTECSRQQNETSYGDVTKWTSALFWWLRIGLNGYLHCLHRSNGEPVLYPIIATIIRLRVTSIKNWTNILIDLFRISLNPSTFTFPFHLKILNIFAGHAHDSLCLSFSEANSIVFLNGEGG